MTTNLDRMHAIDLAWNERRWEDYGALLDDRLVAYMAGDECEHDKVRHLEKARAFCAAHPDARVIADRYLDLFESRDGTRTCSIARLVGTAGLSGKPVERRSFDVTFTVVCEWQDGRVVRQREYLDNVTLARQLGG
ncbi:MAG TPA: ester cyclase [Burkholderiaceae bacterium]